MHDRTNYSSRIIFSYTFTKYELDRKNRLRDMVIQCYSRRMTVAIFGFGPTGSRNIRSADPRNVPQNQTRSESHDPLQKYGHSTFSKTATGRHPTGSSAIRSVDVENPTLKPNMTWIWWSVAEIWPFEIFQHDARSVVGRWSSVVGRRSVDPQYKLIHWCHVLLFATRRARSKSSSMPFNVTSNVPASRAGTLFTGAQRL